MIDTEPDTSFIDVFRSLKSADGVYRAEPSDEWRQGRTLFGGLTAALALGAAKREFPDLPPLRAAQFSFVGPAAEGLALTPRLIRAGKSTSFVNVVATSGNETALRAMFVFGAARRSSHSYDAVPMPDVAAPDELPDFFDGAMAPRFSGRFHGRRAGGARVVSGSSKPELLLWVRHRDSAAPDDATSIIALGDVPPPAAMTMFVTPAPISTITWSVDVLSDRFVGAAWHLIHVEAETVSEGYSSQRMTMWSASGEPLIAARQTVAIFG